ncbi:MAG: chemotaxis protein CheW [Alphaproteobacteria bacterium]|nr:chemotaxis protein CheW [Alphaproteobacteria bacterium]MBF0249035.1 chemotaxis protein CheW [Alphaproteobacteria bacterium]
MSGQALVTTGSTDVDAISGENRSEFVTFNIAGQLFGIPVLIVQDILVPEKIASIPLAPPEVRGSINLRGRIVTVVDVRVRLGLKRRDIVQDDVKEAKRQGEDGSANNSHAAVEAIKRKKREHMMGVTVDHQNELYTLLVDSVGDVISLKKDKYEGNPSTLDPVWREFASGVYRLDKSLMVVLDVDRLLNFKANA